MIYLYITTCIWLVCIGCLLHVRHSAKRFTWNVSFNTPAPRGRYANTLMVKKK